MSLSEPERSLLTDAEAAALYLPGTIALPGPYPKRGRISVQERTVAVPGQEPFVIKLMVIEQAIPPFTTVRRELRLEQVSAVMTIETDAAGRETRRWFFGASVPAIKSGVDGIVYALEHAAVLMNVSYGTTASECLSVGFGGGGGCDPDCCRQDEFPMSIDKVLAP